MNETKRLTKTVETSKESKKSAAIPVRRVEKYQADFLTGFLYIIVPLIPLIVFWFVPMVVSLLLSFTDWDYISPKINIVGITNYTSILTSEAFWQAFKNTIVFGLGTVLPTLAIGFLLALLLRGVTKGRPVIQGFLFSPWITSMVAMSIVWSWMFRPSGLINYLLSFIGVDGPNWLSDSSTAMLAVIIVTIWKSAGWAMLYYADAMSKIPESLFEVATLEGASTWQNIVNLYLPMTKNTTFFLGIISLINSIQAYDQISVLTGGGPAGATRTLLYLFYQTAFTEFNMGKATAIAMIIVVITAFLSYIMSVAKKRFDY